MNDLPEEFRVSDVARILNVSQRNLSQWCDRGLVRPEKKASGSGTRNLFTLEDLCRTALFLRLSRTFSLPGASAVAFASQGHPIHHAFFAALAGLSQHGSETGSSKSLLARTPPPGPLFVAFVETEDGMEASRPCASPAELTRAFETMQAYAYFLVVNLTSIAEDVLAKVSGDRS
ncbi:MAG: MerR family transcriptional regulator [Thermodesulfobacteriota bacterium]